MKKEELIDLYQKERSYQTEIFGEYKNNPSLNLGSFILFLDAYVQKAKKYYVSKWDKEEETPKWLLSSRELFDQGSCPSDCYQELVKIFTIAGAALEAYLSVDVSKWRDEGIKEKWKDLI